MKSLILVTFFIGLSFCADVEIPDDFPSLLPVTSKRPSAVAPQSDETLSDEINYIEREPSKVKIINRFDCGSSGLEMKKEQNKFIGL